MTDTISISRRKMLQLMFGACFVLPLGRTAYADNGGGDEGGGGDGNNDDEEDNGDEDPDPIAPLTTPGAPSQSTFPAPNLKPSKKKGKVLNQDEAKAAIAKGNAATLQLLLVYVANKYPGKILDVKLRLVDSFYIYEVKLLANKIFLRTLLLDAKTLTKL